MLSTTSGDGFGTVQGAARLLADLEGDIKRKYFGYCFIIFINLQYTSQIFYSLRFENNIGMRSVYTTDLRYTHKKSQGAKSGEQAGQRMSPLKEMRRSWHFPSTVP